MQLPIYDSGAIRFRSVYEFKELLRYRFLLTNLVVRDLKVRYKRSVLGFVWVMLSPLLTMGVLALVFTELFKRFDIPHYAAYLLVGLLLWNLFAQATVASMSTLIGSAGILRRMYVPPSVFVASSIGSAFVNLLFSLLPFALLAYLTGVQFTWWWLLLIVPCVGVTFFAFGIGLLLASAAVFFTDTVEIYAVLLNIYVFLTPMYYPATILPKPIQDAEIANPMALYLEIARAFVLEGHMPHLHVLALAGVYTIGIFLIGWLVFTRLESRFAFHF